MSARSRGLLERKVIDTPVAILDFETTGLRAGVDRVVEVSVVRIEPGQAPRLLIDTLVNPERPVSATEIHGITDDDVADAPRFKEIAGHVVRGLYDCVLASYNIYFDIEFLKYELRKAGLDSTPPHLCLMYLRPMLGLGCRCSLGDACKFHGIDHGDAHQTAYDASAAAKLWGIYCQIISEHGLRTFRDIATLKSYKFVQSFQLDPLSAPLAEKLGSSQRLKSRSIPAGATTILSAASVSGHVTRQDAVHDYWEALKTVLSDLVVTDEEMDYLSHKQQGLGLTKEEIRGLHARAFGSIISRCIDDKLLDDTESRTLRRLHQCLSKLGWAPGE